MTSEYKCKTCDGRGIRVFPKNETGVPSLRDVVEVCDTCNGSRYDIPAMLAKIAELDGNAEQTCPLCGAREAIAQEFSEVVYFPRRELLKRAKPKKLSIVQMVDVICRDLYAECGQRIFTQREMRQEMKARFGRDVKWTTLQPIIARKEIRENMFPLVKGGQGRFYHLPLEIEIRFRKESATTGLNGYG